VAGQSIFKGTAMEAFVVKEGIDHTSIEGIPDTPYAIPLMHVGLTDAKPSVTVLWWRSVGHSHTAFVMEHTIDQLARKAGKDPVEYRKTLYERAGAKRHLAALNLALEKAGPAPVAPGPVAETEPWVMRHDRDAYLDRIRRSLHEIADGESYEVCLCNEWTRSYEKDPLATYKLLRSINPAPYSAFLRFDDLSVLSCSPERMVHVSKEGMVSCKPIKGTIARGKTEAEDFALMEQLRTSEKDQAENLMIVDLIRNDLNRVCRTGTVAVPHLCAIESFATVHQMVSTVVGELRNSETAVSCVRSLFPGGSMTGAPKVRTMEIIDGLEAGPRGIYSGAIGYFSLDAAVDLNIVIRTVVLNGTHASVGAGGAIIALSDPVGEFDETMLKGELLRTTLMRLDSLDERDGSAGSILAAQ